MGTLRRFLDRRRHRHGRFGFLFEPHGGGECVAIDLETTGLDPASDHILSIAAVPVAGSRIRLSQRFERTVRPERGFGIDSIRHHRITPDEAAAGTGVRRAVEDLLLWLRNRPLVGFHVRFDLAMLDPHVRAVTGFALPNRHEDIARTFLRPAGMEGERAEADFDLEQLAARLGVPVLGRHSALGDAVTVAMCRAALHARGRRGGGHRAP
ncbi:MAG: exonuclease domain-containing protein [Lysobacteraceae bacterium]